jgi:hypothetical protein
MVRRHLLHLLLASLTATAAWAQARPAASSPPPPLSARIRGLFDLELPDLDPPGTVKLILHPHLSDLVRRDYLRTDAGFRWALNDQFELSAEAGTFLTHGLGGGGDGYGIGKLSLGTKYVFHEWLHPEFETSAGIKVDLPVGHPPVDFTDGLDHYTPNLVMEHHWTSNAKLTTFAGASLDFVGHSAVRGTIQPNQPHDNSASLTLGGVYDVGQLKWTLAGTYTTTALVSNGPEHFFYLQPSVLWYVPKKITFNSKTQWIVGVSAPLTWGPDGFEFKVNSRLRAEITFRQVMDKMRMRFER